MRRYPNRVRSVILKGVVPMSLILPHVIARDAQRSLDLLFADCAADEPCRRAYPNLKQEFQVVLNRLVRETAKTKLSDPSTNEVEQVEISRGLFATTLRSLLQNINTTNQVPLLIHSAFGNDFEPFARLALTLRRGAADLLSSGMFLSVICAEDIPLTNPNVVAREGKGTFLGDYYARQVMQASEIWRCGRRPRGYNQPVRSNLPVLLISGHLDPATPPSGAAETSRYLPNSLHLVIKNGSHSYAGLSPCVDNIMAAFIEKGSVTGLDTSCTNQIRRLPFAIISTESKPKENIR
jgi:pimeloyl-ACP methyl ester carboxylesterase